jgi:hypothetical protein
MRYIESGEEEEFFGEGLGEYGEKRGITFSQSRMSGGRRGWKRSGTGCDLSAGRFDEIRNVRLG